MKTCSKWESNWSKWHQKRKWGWPCNLISQLWGKCSQTFKGNRNYPKWEFNETKQDRTGEQGTWGTQRRSKTNWDRKCEINARISNDLENKRLSDELKDVDPQLLNLNYICKICDEGFANLGWLKSHKLEKHEKEKRIN